MENNINQKLPVVSIITVVYNGVDTLEKTILSIFAQSYPHIEYIVVDGGSDDGTMDLIQKHATGITHWISEPDKGLYDAMNKGIAMATGDYLWFINSGDEIAGPRVLEAVFQNNRQADIYYGETRVIDASGNILGNRRLKPPPQLKWQDFRKGMLVSHQSVIIKKAICNHYDTSFRFSADYLWVLSALKRSTQTVNTNMVLSIFLEGGLTRKNILPGLKERFRIMVKHFGLLGTLISHVPIAFRFFRFYITHGRF